jgi:hypothetical protein
MTPLLLALTLLPAAPTTAELGPALGQRLPAFEAQAQDGRQRSFDSLSGPKGLVLVFFRSADW